MPLAGTGARSCNNGNRLDKYLPSLRKTHTSNWITLSCSMGEKVTTPKEYNVLTTITRNDKQPDDFAGERNNSTYIGFPIAEVITGTYVSDVYICIFRFI